MSTKVPNVIRSSYSLFVIVLFAFTQLAYGNENECKSLLPADAAPAGSLKICTSSFNGVSDQYSCQDYKTVEHNYRVLYKSGLIPKAIVSLDKSGNENLMWSTFFEDRPVRCPLLPPAGISIHAKHMGVGVCFDDEDKKVPCSVYQHAVARDKEAYRYMVFYSPDGKGAQIVDQQYAGNNNDAMVAEIAYQIGVQLLNTECCSERAIYYLKYAFTLFPQTPDYRAAYNSAKLLAQSE